MHRKMINAEALCAFCGLSRKSLDDLEVAGLLRPDRPGEYRSKQATWARKLAYLLDAGWTLPEIKTWARVRWTAPNPRQWPPDRQLGYPKEGWTPHEDQVDLQTRTCDN